MTQNDELLYTWSAALNKTGEGKMAVATRTAEKLKDGGYSADETYDLMIADEYDTSVIESAIKLAYKTGDKKEEVTASFQPLVVPTCYEDVKPIIEKTLASCKAKEFVERLAMSEYPILPNYPDKKRISLIRLATNAKNDKYALEILHKELTPFVENAMYEAVIAAEKRSSKYTISETTNSKYVVASSMKNTNDVCLETGACTCDKYTKGNYADFGLACEHLITVANSVSPNHKLVRGVIE